MNEQQSILLYIYNANSSWYLKLFNRLKTTQLNISGFIFHCKRFNDLRRKCDSWLSLNYDDDDNKNNAYQTLCSVLTVQFFMQPNEMKSPMQLIRPNEMYNKFVELYGQRSNKKKPVFA